MTDLPLVSALVPVYNYGHFLGRTLDSALAQDYPADRLEIVVVDDGSTDNTPEVLADYQERFPDQMRVFRQENAGFVEATNATFRHAKGELLAFLDSDDLWPVTKTREQVEILMARPAVGMVYSDTELIDPYDAVLQASVWEWYDQTPVRGPGTLIPLITEPHGNPALNSTIMLRASLLDQFAPIPASVPYVDWWVAARIGQVAELETNLGSRVGYRTHGENITLGATGLRAVREVLKAVTIRRQLMIRGAADALSTRDMLKSWKTWEEGAAYTTRLAKTVFLPLPEPTAEEREAARRHAEEAAQATREARYEDALRHRLLAVNHDPWDLDSREWIGDLQPAAFNADPWPEPLAEARSKVVLAFLAELETEPQLLEAYAGAVTDADDVTLAIEAAGLTEGEVVPRVQQLLRSLGLDAGALPDVLLVTQEPERLIKLELERRADAWLSRRPTRLGTPAFSPERMDALRAAVLGD